MSAERCGASGVCAHCGLPTASARTRRGADEAPEAEREPAFCCSGCYVAYHLTGAGLEHDSDRLLARLVLSAFLAMGVMVFSLSLYGSARAVEPGGEAAAALTGLFRMGAFALSLPVLLLLGAPLGEAVVRMRRWLSADALVLAGAGAAWAVSAWNTLRGGGHVYFDTATGVLVLVTLGRWLDVRSRERARASFSLHAAEGLDRAVRVDGRSGEEHELRATELVRGDLVRVRPGETVPVDGAVVEGSSFVDASELTGEEQPRRASAGTRVLAGARLLDGTLLVRTERGAGERVRDEIERLLQEAAGRRPRLVRAADRVAGGLLPLVLAIALGTALWHAPRAGPEPALLAALSVVLIACPCALGIATPLAFWVALGRAWRLGAIVRGGDVLERLARVRRVFLDKTGTLTSGELELSRTIPRSERARSDPLGALAVAAALEAGSEHPIGRAFRSEWARTAGARALPSVRDFRALPGVGVAGTVDGAPCELRRASGAAAEPPERSGATRVELVRAGEVLAEYELAGEPRPEAAAVVAALARRGLAPTVLTGDARGAGEELARALGIPVEAELLPQDKVARVRAAGPTGVLFVGDGLNDLAALAAADVGVALPRGRAVELSGADVGFLRPDLGPLPELLSLARRATRVARANLAWAFGYNAIGLALAASGRLSPLFAASAMVVSSLVVVLNSARLAGGGGAGRVAPRPKEGSGAGAPGRERLVPTREGIERTA